MKKLQREELFTNLEELITAIQISLIEGEIRSLKEAKRRKSSHYAISEVELTIPHRLFYKKGMVRVLPVDASRRDDIPSDVALLKIKLKAIPAVENVNIDIKKFVGDKKTKKVHMPQCRFVKMIDIDNRVFFERLKDAIDMGYKPCEVCLSRKTATTE